MDGLHSYRDLPAAIVSNASKTAPAQLLTAMADSAPLISQMRSSTLAYREPRRPLSRSNSRFEYRRLTALRCSMAVSASSERPRLVWMTIPVALTVSRRFNDSACRTKSLTPVTTAASAKSSSMFAGSCSIICRRRLSRSDRMERMRTDRGTSLKNGSDLEISRTWSTAGRFRKASFCWWLRFIKCFYPPDAGALSAS